MNIQGWVGREVVPFEVHCRGQSTKLGSGLECPLDDISRGVAKMWAEGNVVWFLCLNIAGIDGNAQVG